MKKSMKKILAFVSSAAMMATMITVPVTTSNAAVGATYKFDFGETAPTDSSWIQVLPTRNYTTDDPIENGPAYGFIGNNEKDYRLNGGRVDGFHQQQGQKIDLQNGGAADGGEGGLLDGIGSRGEDKDHNAGDKFYPVRFALQADDDTYWKVKATVTTFDPTKEATASLYTERKHPLYTEKKIAAGETVTTEWTVRVTPIYYEKSDPKGAYPDGMVNVALLGENTALASLEFEQISTAPTLWILGDSTVTDGGGTLPFWPLQNYTGVGTGVTKYLPGDIAMVNEGEGGLAANDSNHFNMVKSRIKAGDYMWVEYGHNHKDDGPAGYTNNLSKYYDACKAVGATLILVGPIDRIQSSQYTSGTNTWSQTLKGFSDAAKAYVDAKLAANPNDKVAFVDLGQPSLDWYGEVTASGTVGGQAVTNEEKLIRFYFQTPYASAKTDTTHPNDAGADNLAYLFFKNADKTAYPALAPLLTRMETGAANPAEKPTSVSPDVIDAGYPANSKWPQYAPLVEFAYPIVIRNIILNDDNEFETMTVQVQASFSNYAAGVLQIIDEDTEEVINTYVTVDHCDNTNGTGMNTLHFDNPENPTGILPKLEDGQTYRAYMWPKDTGTWDLMEENEEEGITYLSSMFYPSNFLWFLLPGEEDITTETFSYYGKKSLEDSGKWASEGNNSRDLSLGEDEEVGTYTNIAPKGDNNSFIIKRSFENLEGGTGTEGTYQFEMDIKYISGSNALFELSNGWKNSSPWVQGTVLQLFTIGNGGKVTVKGTDVGQLQTNSWTHFKYTLDMDSGVASVSIGGADPTQVIYPEYQTYVKPSLDSLNHFVVTTAVNRGSFNIQLANLQASQLKHSGAQAKFVVTADEDGAATAGEYGSVYIGETAGVTEQTVLTGSYLTATAVPTENGIFTGWYLNDELFLPEETISLRLYQDLNLVAKFIKMTAPTDVTVNYLDGEGKVIKSPVTITANELNQQLFEDQSYTLLNSYKAAIKNASKVYTDKYDVYFFKSADKESFDSLGAQGTNVINLTYEHDGVYFDYEDFENTTDVWGFTAGKNGSVAVSNGELRLLVNGGTDAQHSDTNTLSADIAATKKLTIKFDWRSDTDIANTRNSTFNLKDSQDNVIFSLFGGGKDGTTYAINATADKSGNKLANTSDQWISVVLTMDFEEGALSGSLLNKSTGESTTIASTPITATNLAKLVAAYGYSAAAQRIDNIGIRDNDPKVPVEVKEALEVSEGGEATATVTNNTTSPVNVTIISAAYNDEGTLVEVKYVPVTIAAKSTQELATGALTNTGDEVKAFLWNTTKAYVPMEIATPETVTP